MSVVKYELAGNAASLSPAIWADLPTMKMVAAPADFVEVYDDFAKGVTTDTTVPGWGFVGTNADVTAVADEESVIELEGSGADNDSAFIVSNPLYDLTMNSGKRFWFEARVKVEDEDADQAIVVGLIEAAGMTAEAVADNGADLIDEDFIGFYAETDGTNMGDIKAAYRQGGGTTTDVDADSHSPANDTFVKLGMKFDGKETVTFYVNGASVATLDVGDLTGDSLTNKVGVILGVKDCAAAQTFLAADWVRFVAEKFASGF